MACAKPQVAELKSFCQLAATAHSTSWTQSGYHGKVHGYLLPVDGWTSEALLFNIINRQFTVADHSSRGLADVGKEKTTDYTISGTW